MGGVDAPGIGAALAGVARRRGRCPNSGAWSLPSSPYDGPSAVTVVGGEPLAAPA